MCSRYLIAICLAILLIASGIALGARTSHSRNSEATRPVRNMPAAGGPGEDFSTDKAASLGTAMGFLGPEDRFIGWKVGSTWYDYQHNGTMGRQIARGADGRIHFVWTHKPNGTTGSANRSVFYNSAIFSGGAWALSHDTSGTTISSPRGGYCNVGVWGNLAIPAWHEGVVEYAYSTYSGIDFASGSASFTTSAAPVAPTCSGTETNDDDGLNNYSYIWPIIEVDAGTMNDPVVMAVACESVDDPGDDRSMVYFRGTGNPTNYGPCGIFIDTVMDISPIVRQDPNSDLAVMAWLRPRGVKTDYNQYNNDVMLMYSFDNGMTWGPALNLTNYSPADPNRPYSDLTGMFTNDGCFHLVWSSLPYDEVNGTVTSFGNLEHWDDCNACFSMLIETDNYNPDCGGPGRWNANVAKPNLVECDGKLYCTYTRFLDDMDAPDCSAGGWANGELFVQVSSTGGETWGPPVNLSNTPDNGCVAGDCESEHWASAVMYADSLYIFYVGDTDAGGWAGGSTSPKGTAQGDRMMSQVHVHHPPGAPEGTAQEDPMMFYVHECFDMETYVYLSAKPNSFGYPFSTAPGVPTDTSFVLQNSGNTTAFWNSSISYTAGSGWLQLIPSSGSVAAGCDNTAGVDLTATGPGTEGLYEATITINYGTGIQEVDVELYCFDPFCLPEHVRLRTNAVLMSVAQEGRAANQVDDAGFAFFVDTTNYSFDGGLILSNPNTGSWDFNVFHALSEDAPPTNPWGRLYAYDCPPVVDTVSYQDPSDTYRYVAGSGVNNDSTIAFDVTWYASAHPDSNDFIVAHIALGPGPKLSSELTGVTVAYACDWDVPSDTNVDNQGYVDETEQIVYQQGLYPGSVNENNERYAGIAYRGHDETNEFAAGGEVWDNPRYVYPNGGYHVDTLSARLPGMSGWSVNVPESSWGGDDLNSIIVIDNDATISLAKGTNPEFNLVFLGINPNSNPGADYASILRKAEKFICDYVSPDAPYCESGPLYPCGDMNGDDIANITDAVYLIQYLFGGGPPPVDSTAADVDLCGGTTIADAYYLICFAVNNGPDPCEPDFDCTPPSDENYISLSCPVEVVLPGTDPVPIEVHIETDDPLFWVSLGFHYDSDDIEAIGLDFTGSVLVPDGTTPAQQIDTENNTVWFFRSLGWCNEPPTPLADGLVCKILFDIPPGTPNQVVDIDSITVGDSWSFEVGTNGGKVVPHYLDCDSADIIIVSDTCAAEHPGDADGSGELDA
ncbi:MAG: hypothetical protein ABIJ61_11210, partial [bacterium]